MSYLLQFIFATPLQFYVGRNFYRAALKSLRRKTANVDVLVVLSTTSAYFYSVIAIILSMTSQRYHDEVLFVECGVLITIILLGKVKTSQVMTRQLLENVSKGKTSQAIKTLPSLQAKNGILLQMNRSESVIESEMEINVKLIQKGDVLKVPDVVS